MKEEKTFIEFVFNLLIVFCSALLLYLFICVIFLMLKYMPKHHKCICRNILSKLNFELSSG